MRYSKSKSASKQLQDAIRSSSQESEITDQENDEHHDFDEGTTHPSNGICSSSQSNSEGSQVELGNPEIGSQESSCSSEYSLFREIVSAKSSHDLAKVSITWINLFNNNPTIAVRNFKILAFDLAGCTFEKEDDDLWSLESNEILEALSSRAPAGSYPLANKGMKRIHSSINELLVKIVESSGSALLNGELLTEIAPFLCALANCNVRALRHTGVFVGLKLMTALVPLHLKLQSMSENAKNSLDAAMKTDAKSDRCRSIKAHYNKTLNAVQVISKAIDEFIRVIISHGYIDPCADIKLICIEEMGKCMHQHPAFFLKDGNLKYIFSNLFDQLHIVKVAALKLTSSLYEVDEAKFKLHLFSAKTKAVFVRMCNASEVDVRVQCIRILTKQNEFYNDLLSADDKAVLFDLTLSNHLAVACEAGKFIHSCYFSDSVDPDVAQLEALAEMELGSKKTKAKKNSIQCKANQANMRCISELARLIDDRNLAGEVAYVVDSLWECSPMLRDWAAMVALLMREDCDDNEDVSPSYASNIQIIAEILASSAERSVTCQATPRRDRPRQSVTKQRADRHAMSEVLASAIPSMLKRYAADAGVVQHLLKLPLYLDLDVFTKTRLEKSLEDAMRSMAEIVQRHVDAQVLDAAAQVFGLLNKSNSAISSRCLTLFDGMVTAISKSMSIALRELLAASWVCDEHTRNMYDLFSSGARKLAALFAFNDLTKHRIHKPALCVLKAASERRLPFEIPDIVEACSKCTCFSLIWMARAAKVFDSVADEEELTSTLIASRDKAVDLLQTILEIEEYAPAHDSVFTSLGDILLLFADAVPSSLSWMQPFVFKPSSAVQDALVRFINTTLRQWIFQDNDEASSSTQQSSSDKESSASGFPKWQELQVKRRHIAVFSRLLFLKVIDIRAIVPLVRHYYSGNADFGDLLKDLLIRCRKASPVATGLAIHDGLLGVYIKCMRHLGSETYRSDAPEFAIARRLALMLSQSFGVDLRSVSLCVMTIHRAGFSFVFSSKDATGRLGDLPYLDLLRYFTPKLVLADRKVIKREYDEVKGRLGAVRIPASGHEAMRSYELSLDPSSADKDLQPPAPVGGPQIDESADENPMDDGGSARKKKRTASSRKKAVSTSSDGRISGWTSPTHTSTAVRGKGRKLRLEPTLDDQNKDDDDDELEIIPEPRLTRASVVTFETRAKASPAKKVRTAAGSSGITPLKESLEAMQIRNAADGRVTRANSRRVVGGKKVVTMADDEDGFEPLQTEEFSLELPAEDEDAADATIGNLSDEGEMEIDTPAPAGRKHQLRAKPKPTQPSQDLTLELSDEEEMEAFTDAIEDPQTSEDETGDLDLSSDHIKFSPDM